MAYGDQSVGTELSDSDILKADKNFTPDSRIKQIDYCWNGDSTGELVGLRTTVGTPEYSQVGNTFGTLSEGACAAFVMGPNEVITTIYFLYTAERVTAFSFVTNENNGVNAGSKPAGAQTAKENFGEGLPFMGFKGTSTGEQINSLGMVTFWANGCPNYVYTGVEESFSTGAVTDSSGLKTGATVGIVVGVVSLVLIATFAVLMLTVPSFAALVIHAAHTLLKLLVTCFCWHRTRQIRRAQPDAEPNADDLENNSITVKKINVDQSIEQP